MSLEKEGQFTEDTKLFKTVKTKVGFKGVHENHDIKRHKSRVQTGEGKQSKLLKSLLKNNKIQILVLCFSFAS